MSNTQSTPRKAAIYLRISQDREMDGLAIDRQREDCENLARYRGWDIVETYVDQSVSATDKNKTRPAYELMVKDYQAGLFSAIVCYDLDRLTRQPRQLEDWIDAAESSGLALVTANGDADLSTDGGRMYARIKAAVARSEMERKSARQSRAQQQRSEQGRAPKGMRPLGYATSGDVITDEAKAVATVYLSFTRTVSPGSLRSIARALSGEVTDPAGIPHLPKHSHTVSRERAEKRIAEGLEPREIKPDGPWSPSTVLGILRNPRYAGYSTYTPKEVQEDGNRRRSWKAQIVRDETGEPVKGQWETVVDEETWWKVQEILDDKGRITNTSGSTKRKHLGSGLYRCHECRKYVRGAARGYRCAGHVLRTGSHIDKFVIDVMKARLSKPDLLRTIQAPEDTPKTQALLAAISEQRARISRAERDYDEEITEGHDLKRIRDSAQSRIEDLEAERLMTNKNSNLMPILGADDPAEVFENAPLEVQREVIDTLAVVSIKHHPKGLKGFNPESVTIEWR